MKKDKLNLMTRHWAKYWENHNAGYSKKMEFFQFEAFFELKKYVNDILTKQKICRILNAGSGVDKIAYYLNKTFKDKLDITLLDISENCLLQNRKIFGYNSNITMEKGDIFKTPKVKEKYDIIYNTGLLEHFDNINQGKIFENISIMLKRGGYFLTFNPSIKGSLYIKMKELAEKKNTWEYGEENPMKTLEQLNKKYGMVLLYEKDMASMQQIYFLKYINRSFKLLAYLISYLEYFPSFYFIVADYFGGKAGYYIIASMFQKES